ncbi:MAG: hypothetical protein ABW133_25670, partial [Polyangiaceae bacterium]
MSRRSFWLLGWLVAGCASPRAAAPLVASTPTVDPAPKKSEAIPATPPWQPPKLDAARRAKFEKIVPELDKLFTEDQRVNGAPGLGVGIVIGGETVYA